MFQVLSSWAFLFRVKNVLENKTMIKLPGFREAVCQWLVFGGSSCGTADVGGCYPWQQTARDCKTAVAFLLLFPLPELWKTHRTATTTDLNILRMLLTSSSPRPRHRSTAQQHGFPSAGCPAPPSSPAPRRDSRALPLILATEVATSPQL